MSHRSKVLDLIKPNFICAEIGVWKGNFSQQILDRQPKQLYLIDPWAYQDYDSRWYNIEQTKMDQIYRGVVDRFKDYTNVIITRDYSINTNFSVDFFDWVYVDGDHSYLNVLEDLNYYYPLIKSGGFLCGDDYGWDDKDNKDNPEFSGGPKRAVDEFVSKNNLSLNVHNDQFFIHKT